MALFWALAEACAPATPAGVANAGQVDPASPRATAQQAVQNRCADSDTLLEGVDVSFWQGEVDWDRVAATDAAFAIVRSSYHRHTQDEQIARNWSELARVGMWRGAYHYLIPGADPYVQADLFLDGLVAGGGWRVSDLPPVLDIEDLRGRDVEGLTSDIEAWFATVERATGERAMIYTGSYFWDATGLGARFTDRPLWTAHYTSNPCPLIGDAWDDWQFWQYTDSGSVDGVRGDVDRNVFDGDEAALAAFANSGMPAGACEATAALARSGVAVPACEESEASWTTTRRAWASELASAAGVAVSPSCPTPFSDVDDVAVSTLSALTYSDSFAVFDPSADAFRPDDALTRCEAVKTIVEAWNLAPASTTLGFADEVPAWCVAALETAVNAAIVPRAPHAFRGNDAVWHFELHGWLAAARARYGVPSPPPSAFAAACGLDCDDACEAGDTACFGTQIRRCGDVDADACLEWAPPEPCGAGERCDAGVCVEATGAFLGLCEVCSTDASCVEEQRCVEASFDPSLLRCAIACGSAPECPRDFTCSLEGVCVPQFVEACVEGDVWSFDACGEPVGALIECADTERCEEGRCVAVEPPPTPIEGSGDQGPLAPDDADAGSERDANGAGQDARLDSAVTDARRDTPARADVASSAGDDAPGAGGSAGCAIGGVASSSPWVFGLLLLPLARIRRFLAARASAP